MSDNVSPFDRLVEKVKAKQDESAQFASRLEQTRNTIFNQYQTPINEALLSASFKLRPIGVSFGFVEAVVTSNVLLGLRYAVEGLRSATKLSITANEPDVMSVRLGSNPSVSIPMATVFPQAKFEAALAELLTQILLPEEKDRAGKQINPTRPSARGRTAAGALYAYAPEGAGGVSAAGSGP